MLFVHIGLKEVSYSLSCIPQVVSGIFCDVYLIQQSIYCHGFVIVGGSIFIIRCPRKSIIACS